MSRSIINTKKAVVSMVISIKPIVIENFYVFIYSQTMTINIGNEIAFNFSTAVLKINDEARRTH